MIDTKQVAGEMADEALVSISTDDIEDELINVYGASSYEAEILALQVAEYLDIARVEIGEN